MCASLEAEVAGIEDEAERRELLASMGLSASALEEVHHAAMKQLRRRVFFTTGPQETRAWLVRAGAQAPEAAGVIHTDFEKKFIRADVVGFDDFIALDGEKGAREAGKLRSEGKEYEVQDGDVMVFKHGG
jgi:ribosome-binding ATPase YchF (GTP1/OBG family)